MKRFIFINLANLAAWGANKLYCFQLWCEKKSGVFDEYEPFDEIDWLK